MLHIHIHICTYVYIYICTYEYIYICTYEYIYIYICVCKYIYTYRHRLICMCIYIYLAYPCPSNISQYNMKYPQWRAPNSWIDPKWSNTKARFRLVGIQFLVKGLISELMSNGNLKIAWLGVWPLQIHNSITGHYTCHFRAITSNTEWLWKRVKKRGCSEHNRVPPD